ncbi:uncharacterized, partial [Tachysurus ichikawai]
ISVPTVERRYQGPSPAFRPGALTSAGGDKGVRGVLGGNTNRDRAR